MSFFSAQVKNSTRVAITIPANGGTGTSIATLLQTAGYVGQANAVVISGWLAGSGNAGTQRPAFIAATPRGPSVAITATDVTTHGEYVPAGQTYYMPVETDATNTYVQSTTASTITALCTVLL